ncbi:cytochrome P450 [Micromonospora carbonacea]|uniref:Cytochrome P450 n=1 Tax=Micromonospora carbonacea TaxID=47853 RepID=A0A7H8XIF4_9ACTN|nr:cytochrome P450 [Micromonospora carbonacea]MBB5828887.1 cytochrome P450 [Micromonospora carbonacea]QLD23572.1 cytochrome P450 [Micromonospora carbonacea]
MELTRPGTLLRWVDRHGLARLGISAAARRGDAQARLFFDPAIRADPYPFYREVREAGALVRGRLMWSTTRHDAVVAVLRGEAFSSDPGSLPAPGPLAVLRRLGRRGRPIGPADPPSMLVVDPPAHTRYRRLVAKVFTPRAIEGLRPRIERHAAALLDGLAPDAAGAVEVVGRYASLLPLTVIAEILGVPQHLRQRFLAWGEAATPTLDLGLTLREYRAAEAAIGQLNGWLRGHFARLRADPGDDLLSRLVHLDSDGERLTEDELLAIAGLLLVAGFETTVNLLGTGIHLLIRHPDQLAELRGRPDGWANAVEEILRYDSPAQTTARYCLADTEVAGVRVRAGEVVVPMMGGANRDPAVFADPDRFDVTRANARDHLSFSSGVHYCLGAALARMEGQLGLRAFFERYPDAALAGTPRRRATRVLRGYDQLPVRLRP